jgi:hypothetical protein
MAFWFAIMALFLTAVRLLRRVTMHAWSAGTCRLVAPCTTRSLIVASSVLLFISSAASGASDQQADNVVLRWNQAVIEAIRTTRAPPPVAARAFAIAHTCIFDAWAAYDERAFGTSFGKKLHVPKNDHTVADRDKAISFAAYRALADLFPGLRSTQFESIMFSMGYQADEPPAGPLSPTGIAELACDAVLRMRHADGSNQMGDLHTGAYSDYTNYSSANTVEVLSDRNRWQPLLVNGVPQRWQLPHWGRVMPFGLISGPQFRSAVLSQGPIVYPSDNYWRETLDVLRLSAQLGEREKVIAEYWADGLGTETPPGHWNKIAQEVSRRDRHSIDDDVKMFFILGNTLMDSSIATWDVKRAADSIRPVSVIRATLGSAEIRAWAGPGLGTRILYGRNFRSYLPTPPFSSYVSGHSAFSAAAAEILKRFTGSDYFGGSYTASAGSSLIERGLTPTHEITLSWNTFSEAADQAGISRRYGGIHFECDDLAGRALGRLVANEVWLKALTYIDGETHQ